MPLTLLRALITLIINTFLISSGHRINLPSGYEHAKQDAWHALNLLTPEERTYIKPGSTASFYPDAVVFHAKTNRKQGIPSDDQSTVEFTVTHDIRQISAGLTIHTSTTKECLEGTQTCNIWEDQFVIALRPIMLQGIHGQPSALVTIGDTKLLQATFVQTQLLVKHAIDLHNGTQTSITCESGEYKNPNVLETIDIEDLLIFMSSQDGYVPYQIAMQWRQVLIDFDKAIKGCTSEDTPGHRRDLIRGTFTAKTIFNIIALQTP